VFVRRGPASLAAANLPLASVSSDFIMEMIALLGQRDDVCIGGPDGQCLKSVDDEEGRTLPIIL
jgi:hypothetical protein